MELSRDDSFVVRTEHAGNGFLIEVEAWDPERCSAVAARCARAGVTYFQAAPHQTERGSWLLRGQIRDLQESACLLRGLEVREEVTGPPLVP